MSTTASPIDAQDARRATTMATLSKEEQIRQEFFRTYDLMTGVRIAATLGGFFGMMVLLVLYKSRCRTRRSAIKEVRLAAAKAVVEEEDQQEAVAAAIYMQTVVTGRVPRRSLGALSAPVGPVGPGRGSLAFVGGPAGASSGAAAALGLGGGPGGDLVPRAAFLAAESERADRPSASQGLSFPLPVRFSSLGGCSLLDATVAITSVRRASMMPTPPSRQLHSRLQQHQQRQHQQRHESRQLQMQRLQLMSLDGQDEPPKGSTSPARSEPMRRASRAPRLASGHQSLSAPGPAPAGLHTGCSGGARVKAARAAARVRSASFNVGQDGAPPSTATSAAAPRRHSQARLARMASTGTPAVFALRTPLGVIDSSPEQAASPAGSLGQGLQGGEPGRRPLAQLRARPGRSSLGSPCFGSPTRGGGGDGDGGRERADSSANNSSSCQVLPYGAACESFELAELAYGEAAAPLARISTLETASLKDGEMADSGSDSVFGVLPTQHGQAADTAADTGVDTGQDADTDQDADGQLSTDSNGSGSSTPHQPADHKHRLYVLPVGVAPTSGSDVVTLHEAPKPGRHSGRHQHGGHGGQSAHHGGSQSCKHLRPRPRLARTSKVVAASLDSAASDDCITTTPEQSQEDQEQDGAGDAQTGRTTTVVMPLQPDRG